MSLDKVTFQNTKDSIRVHQEKSKMESGVGTASPDTLLISAISDLCALEVDDVIAEDWHTIHERICIFRREHHLTISKFLEHCGLETRSLFKQFSCKSGFKLDPSRKKGSKGIQYLEKVIRALNSTSEYVATTVTTTDQLGLEDMQNFVYDWFLDNRSMLREGGIVGVHVNISKPQINIVARPQSSISNAQLLTMLDENIRSALQEECPVTRDIFCPAALKSPLTRAPTITPPTFPICLYSEQEQALLLG
jgi:hypothetical protein